MKIKRLISLGKIEKGIDYKKEWGDGNLHQPQWWINTDQTEKLREITNRKYSKKGFCL